MARIILITGGTRSGKSSFALDIAEACGPTKLFVATCPKVDEEMTERIRHHQEERQGKGWFTIEIERNLASIFTEQSKIFDVILIDCITLWVSNLLFQASQDNSALDDQCIAKLCRAWLDQSAMYSGTLVCVTNEIGLGVVPDNALARKYRDLVGTCNQIIGKKADEVVLVSCGIPLYLKTSTNIQR